ncbi:DUF998 domain-containing protein [Qaidamihabitans albus]|uniref:DUF998 domain-containing protein n=1 Tax=Qaidamihabitans albus TaxID=2795733 RepID=UPI0018F1BD6F|nr:DUF998 domain-containing protein [Qaidamihabitans albus]
MAPVFHRPATLGAVRAVTVSLLATGTLALLGWLVQFGLDTGLSPLHAPPGELGAAGRPHGVVFRAAELVAGLALILASPPLLRLAPVHRQARLTVGVVFAVGLLLVLRAAFPLDCAASAGEVCADPSAGHRVHEAASTLLNLAYIVGALSLMLWWPRGWRTLAAVAFAIEVLAWLAVVLLEPGHFAGIVGRVQLVTLLAVICAGAAYLLTAGRVPGGTD